MHRHVKIIKDILSKGPQFGHVIVVDDSAYVANALRDMTAFCHLMIHRRQGLIIVNCELCLTVLPDPDKSSSGLQTKIENRHFVSALLSIPWRNTPDSLVKDGAITGWLFRYICLYLERYSLDAVDGIALLGETENHVIRAMRVVYENDVETRILEPLRELQAAT